MVYSRLFELFAGKASENGSDWLPLRMHSLDTASIMEKLLDNWLSEQAVSICDLGLSELQKLCRFHQRSGKPALNRGKNG